MRINALTTSLTTIVLSSSALIGLCNAAEAEEYYYEEANDNNGNEENNAEANNYYEINNYYEPNQYASDGIDYWTDYAILPLSCITHNNIDVITFQLYYEGHKQCLNEPLGTYKTDVTTYMAGFMAQIQDNAYNAGLNYYESDGSKYLYCTEYDLQNGSSVYMKLGCDDYNKEKLAVNIYKDADCTKRDEKNGSDDAAINTSDLRVGFGHCQGCVVWYDKSDDQIDDNYWKLHRNQAPLCHTVYAAKENCSGSCLKNARVFHKEGWSRPEKGVLFFLFAFLGAAVHFILKINYLKTKDEVLNNAETEEELNQEVSNDPKFKWGLIGTVGSIGLIAFICVISKSKTASWYILFITSFFLFGYLMKLTLQTGYKPCGDTTHYEDDSDDEDDEEDNPLSPKEGYTAPEATASPPRSPAAETTEAKTEGGEAKAETGVMA